MLLRHKRSGGARPQVNTALGVVTVPRALPRFVRLPAEEGHFDYLLLQDLIAQNLGGMYRGYEVLAHAAFGLMNSTPFLGGEVDRARRAELLRAAALSALRG